MTKTRPNAANAAVGSWQNPRHVGGPSPARLERFARVVLAVLDESTDWNAHTVHKISEAADLCGLVSEATTPVLASVLEQYRVHNKKGTPRDHYH